MAKNLVLQHTEMNVSCLFPVPLPPPLMADIWQIVVNIRCIKVKQNIWWEIRSYFSSSSGFGKSQPCLLCVFICIEEQQERLVGETFKVINCGAPEEWWRRIVKHHRRGRRNGCGERSRWGKMRFKSTTLQVQRGTVCALTCWDTIPPPGGSGQSKLHQRSSSTIEVAILIDHQDKKNGKDRYGGVDYVMACYSSKPW